MAEAAGRREVPTVQDAIREFNQKPLQELLQLRTDLYTQLSDEFVDLLLENNIDLETIDDRAGMQDNIDTYIRQGQINPTNPHLRKWLNNGVRYETLESAIALKQDSKKKTDTQETPRIPLESITLILGEIELLKNKPIGLSPEQMTSITREIASLYEKIEHQEFEFALTKSQELLNSLKSKELHFHQIHQEQFESNVKLALAKMDLQERFENKFLPHQKQQILNLIAKGEKHLMQQNYTKCDEIAHTFLGLVDDWTSQFLTQELPALKIIKPEKGSSQHEPSRVDSEPLQQRALHPEVPSKQAPSREQTTSDEDAWFDDVPQSKTVSFPVVKKTFWPLRSLSEYFANRVDRKAEQAAQQQEEVDSFLEKTKSMDIYTLRNYMKKIFHIDIENSGAFVPQQEKQAQKLLKSNTKEAKIFQTLYLEFLRRRTELHKQNHYKLPAPPTQKITNPSGFFTKSKRVA